MTRRMLVVLGSGLVMALCAFGDSSTQWNLTNSGGSYSYYETSPGVGGALTGSGIGVENIVGESTPLESGGTLIISDGVFSFTTGVYDGNGSDYEWGAGASGNNPPSLLVTGCISNVTLVGDCSGSSPAYGVAGSDDVILVDDAFTSATIEPAGPVYPNTEVVFGGVTGTINSAVAAYFGVSTAFVAPSVAGPYIQGVPSPGGETDPFGPGTSYSVTQADPGGNLDLVAAVPEDWNLSSTLAIFAFGLGIFGLARRLGLIKALF